MIDYINLLIAFIIVMSVILVINHISTEYCYDNVIGNYGYYLSKNVDIDNGEVTFSIIESIIKEVHYTQCGVLFILENDESLIESYLVFDNIDDLKKSMVKDEFKFNITT